ncbi:MAG: hypothetical protein ACRC5A_12405 [Enterobacteriaceae bacterium]
MMLKVDLKVGETLIVGEAWITVNAKSGRMTRLTIKADRSVPVRKLETPAGYPAIICNK